MTNNTEQHFDALKLKYKVSDYKDSSPSSPLYFILRKIDLGIKLLEFELDWLKEYELHPIQKLQAQRIPNAHRTEALIKLADEFHAIKSKYKIFCGRGWTHDPLYFILKKLDSKFPLSDSEINHLLEHHLIQIVNIAYDHISDDFVRLKDKYKATQHKDSSVYSPLYPILKLLDAKKRLSEKQINWLESNKLFETLEIFQKDESIREIQFSELKAKYQATKHSDSSVSSPLYQILLNLDADKPLSQSELDWLKQHDDLTETFALVTEIEEKRHFAELKRLYKATECEDSSLSSHLYKVLKQIYAWKKLSESDINFLKKRKLTKTISCAIDRYAASLKSQLESGHPLSKADIEWLKQNGREEIIILAKKKHFSTLKSKYKVFRSGYSGISYSYSNSKQLYEILKKLDQGKRLEPEEFAWLDSENLLERENKIFTTYHKIEAIFYEQEHKRTGNKWNLASASSHWRSAVQAERALKLTENLKIDKIKNNKLKSALLTTRGGAFRDMYKLDKAENCALQAIKYFPNSHHPYTLMGALCYERGDYEKGDMWFEKAIKRGALPRDQDAEIKRVIKRANNVKRRKMMAHLLKKDSQRYKWVKKYIKNLEKKK